MRKPTTQWRLAALAGALLLGSSASADHFGFRRELRAGSEAAVVTSHGMDLFEIKTVAGGFAPVRRARIIAERLENLSDSHNLRPEMFSVGLRNGEVIIQQQEHTEHLPHIVVTVDRNLARRSPGARGSVERLANWWLALLRDHVSLATGCPPVHTSGTEVGSVFIKIYTQLGKPIAHVSSEEIERVMRELSPVEMRALRASSRQVAGSYREDRVIVYVPAPESPPAKAPAGHKHDDEKTEAKPSAPLTHSAPIATETKWALLIGVDQYEEEISPLKYAVADVKAVARALSQHLGFPAERVKLLTSDVRSGIDRPTNINVIKRLDGLANLVKPGDTFLFYFSGHGFQREQRHFLATVNTHPDSVETLQASAIPLELLRQRISKIMAQRVVFIIDACRNSPEKGKGESDNLLTADFSRSLQVVAKASAGGIAGTALLFACSEGERAYEWDEKGHGVFTHYLLEGLSGKAAEASGEVTMSGLGDYVQKNVLSWSKERLAGRMKTQTPDLQQFGAARIVLADRVKSAETTTKTMVTGLDTTAQVIVSSNPPGAKIFVDGKPTGKGTPATIEIELGVLRTKKVEVGLQMTGYKDFVFEVDLQRGKRLAPELIALTRVRFVPQQ